MDAASASSASRARCSACSSASSRRPLRPRSVRCRQVFDSKHGGKKKLEQIDAKLAGLDEHNRAKELKKHAKKHLSQQLRREPLLPFHYVVHDPMHGVHNEINVLLDEAVHKHLMVDSTDEVVKHRR